MEDTEVNQTQGQVFEDFRVLQVRSMFVEYTEIQLKSFKSLEKDSLLGNVKSALSSFSTVVELTLDGFFFFFLTDMIGLLFHCVVGIHHVFSFEMVSPSNLCSEW